MINKHRFINSSNPMLMHLKRNSLCGLLAALTSAAALLICGHAALAQNYGVNLLTDPGAESGNLNGWTILSNGGNGWAVENYDVHSGTNCAVTSWQLDSRSQTVDLVSAGYTGAQLDAAPAIAVGEWVATRFDSGGQYYVLVELQDANHNTVATWSVGNSSNLVTVNAGSPYQLISHTFKNYGAGVRYLHFEDGGHDTNGWDGNYGIRFDDAFAFVYPGDEIVPLSAATGGVALLSSTAAIETGTSLSLTYTTDAAGSVSITSGTAAYSTGGSFAGLDSFRYTITDGGSFSVSGRVVVVAPGYWSFSDLLSGSAPSWDSQLDYSALGQPDVSPWGVALVGDVTWKGSAGKQKASAILTGFPGTDIEPVAFQGDFINEQEWDSNPLTGRRFAAFSNPVIDEEGNIAFAAQIVGAGITTGKNDVVIVSNAANGDNAILTTASNAKLSSISGLSIIALGDGSSSELTFESNNRLVTGIVTRSGSTAAFSQESIIRDGMTVTSGTGETTLKSFVPFAPGADSAGQPRTHLSQNPSLFTATLANGKAALVAADLTGAQTPNVIAELGSSLGLSSTSDSWTKLGVPAQDEGGDSAFHGAYKSGTGKNASTTDGIFLFPAANLESTTPAVSGALAVVGDPANGGGTYASFSDPVVDEDGNVAYLATTTGTTASEKYTGIWLSATDSTPLLAARTQANVIKSINAFALPTDQNPVFVATLATGTSPIENVENPVTTKNDVALLGFDGLGNLEVLAQTSAGTKSVKGVKSIETLGYGEPATTSATVREYGDDPAEPIVVYRVIYTDGTEALETVRP